MINYPDKLKDIAAHIRNVENIMVACHERPDGDAAGSMLGLACALNEAGKNVSCYCVDRIDGNLAFLTGSDFVLHELPEPFPNETTLIIVDCNEADRLGGYGRKLVEQASAIVVLDHHMGNGICQDSTWDVPCLQYIDTEMSAAACICMLLIEELCLPLSEEVAVSLYTAIVTDTGGFRHSNTISSTFEMAARLVKAGADPAAIANRLYQTKTLGSVQLLGLVLDTLSLEAGGRIGALHVTPEMFKKSGASESDMDDYIQYPRSIATVEAAVFVKEIKRGNVSVSLRSKHSLNVEAIAGEFGGGGHFHAAGFRYEGSALEVRNMILKRLEKEFKWS